MMSTILNAIELNMRYGSAGARCRTSTRSRDGAGDGRRDVVGALIETARFLNPNGLPTASHL
jgi:hypothetical protein